MNLPIEAHAPIGNGRSVALVGRDGSIDWMPVDGGGARRRRPTPGHELVRCDTGAVEVEPRRVPRPDFGRPGADRAPSPHPTRRCGVFYRAG